MGNVITCIAGICWAFAGIGIFVACIFLACYLYNCTKATKQESMIEIVNYVSWLKDREGK